MRAKASNLVSDAADSADATVAQVLAEVARCEVKTSRFRTDVLAGGYRATFRGAGIEWSDVREYVEGDDPRQVDWNVSARMGRPFVKRFVEERELTILFALDLHAGFDAGSGAWSLRQGALRLLAMLALAALRNHDRIGLLALGEAGPWFMKPKKGAAHALGVLRAALTLRAPQPGSTLRELLVQANRRLHRRTVVVLLSDFPLPLPETALAACAHRHDLVAVHLLARECWQPPHAVLDLQNRAGEVQRLDLAHAGTRARYQQVVQQWRHELAAVLRRLGIDRIDLELPMQPDLQAILRPLLAFFRKRELREARR